DEARLVARIRHPNVVQTLDVVAEDAELFLVMEYVHGESLVKLVSASTRAGSIVPPRIASAVVSGALHGLHGAHEARSETGEPLPGTKPFTGGSEAAMLNAVLAGCQRAPSAFNKAIPPELDAIVLRGLAREPEHRFANARELAYALERIVPPATASEVGAWVA